MRVFHMTEVERIVGVKDSALRFWETEFPTFAPRRDSFGRRLFTSGDIATALRIKHLLHVRGLSLKEARAAIALDLGTVDPERKAALAEARDELLSLYKSLGKFPLEPRGPSLP